MESNSFHTSWWSAYRGYKLLHSTVTSNCIQILKYNIHLLMYTTGECNSLLLIQTCTIYTVFIMKMAYWRQNCSWSINLKSIHTCNLIFWCCGVGLVMESKLILCNLGNLGRIHIIIQISWLFCPPTFMLFFKARKLQSIHISINMH